VVWPLLSFNKSLTSFKPSEVMRLVASESKPISLIGLSEKRKTFRP